MKTLLGPLQKWPWTCFHSGAFFCQRRSQRVLMTSHFPSQRPNTARSAFQPPGIQRPPSPEGQRGAGVRGRCVRAGRRLMRREPSGGRQRRGQRGRGRLRAAQSRATGHSAAPPEPLPYRGLPAPPCRVTAGGGRCCLGEPCRGGRSHVFLSPPVTQ